MLKIEEVTQSESVKKKGDEKVPTMKITPMVEVSRQEVKIDGGKEGRSENEMTFERTGCA